MLLFLMAMGLIPFYNEYNNRKGFKSHKDYYDFVKELKNKYIKKM